MLTINGVAIPTPSTFGVGIMDISHAERNAMGSMIIERIATKRKLELTWRFLTKPELADLLSRVSDVFFVVTYHDPQTNSQNTGTFYCGDRNVGALDFKNGEVRWQDTKFNLIER